MASKVGKISTIRKENNSSSLQTMEQSLMKKGLSRMPGTGVFKYPYKDLDGRYRTGLDPSASYIQRIQDKVERELEIERVTELKAKLEKALNVDLSPNNIKFWNYGKATDLNASVKPVKLVDGDNFYNLNLPWDELTFSWLRVHPTIASSYEAWQRGEYPADTQFYVVDDEVENRVVYNKKQLINKAIVKFETMTPERKRKVARQLGLPVSEDTKEENVYNLVDNVLKQTEFKSGKHAGLDPIKVFLQYADMDGDLLHVKDLVKQAISHGVYKVKERGKVFEGEYELAVDEDALVKHLMDEENQKDLLMLESKLKTKKLAAV